MTLNLVDSRLHLALGENVYDLSTVEVGDSKASNKALLYKLLHFEVGGGWMEVKVVLRCTNKGLLDYALNHIFD